MRFRGRVAARGFATFLFTKVPKTYASITLPEKQDSINSGGAGAESPRYDYLQK